MVQVMKYEYSLSVRVINFGRYDHTEIIGSEIPPKLLGETTSDIQPIKYWLVVQDGKPIIVKVKPSNEDQYVYYFDCEETVAVCLLT